MKSLSILCALAFSATAYAAPSYRCSTYQGDEHGMNFRFLESFNLDLASGRAVNRYVAADLVASCSGRSASTDGREIVCGFIRTEASGHHIVSLAVADQNSRSLTSDTLHTDNYRYRVYCTQ